MRFVAFSIIVSTSVHVNVPFTFSYACIPARVSISVHVGVPFAFNFHFVFPTCVSILCYVHVPSQFELRYSSICVHIYVPFAFGFGVSLLCFIFAFFSFFFICYTVCTINLFRLVLSLPICSRSFSICACFSVLFWCLYH